MILFAKDWSNYPEAIVDMDTPNRSFVRLASVYRQMGVKNHTFILALHNPKLQGVDPHSKNLTLVQKAWIAVECFENPWYFFREVARAPGLAGSDPVPVEANRGNICLWWCFFNHVTIILIQIRQTGKSFSTDALMALLMNLLCTKTTINLLTKDETLRKKNIERIKDIIADLPQYLNLKTREDANNTEEITVRARGNSYIAHVPQASAKRAANMGRGLTSPIFHVDEGPFQRNIEIALKAALPATAAAIDRAKISGAPYGNIFTTTAGKKNDPDGAYMFKLLMESMIWSDRLFDAKDEVELRQLVCRNTKRGDFRVNATFNHQQLGKTDEWLREKLMGALQDGEEADRDYFNVWTAGGETNPLSAGVLEIITRSLNTDPYNQISTPGGYILRWHIPENEINHRMSKGQFVLSSDTSDASGGDDISLVITDISNGEVIAAGSFNETNLIVFAQWFCNLMVIYDNVTAIIERRSTGAMLIDYLLYMLPEKGIDPFKRLYNTIVQEFDEYPERYEEIRQPMNRRPSNIYIRHKRSFGFATSASGQHSRGELYGDTLQLAARRAGHCVNDSSIINQITTLVMRNGRVDHEVGEHDDMVIGWLLAHWFLTKAKNLAHYGIDVKTVMINARKKDQKTVTDPQHEWEQGNIRREIERLYEELAKCDDDAVAERLEQQLRVMDRKIILENDEVYSLDALLQSARERKRRGRMQNRNRGSDWGGTYVGTGYSEHR